MAKAKAKKSSTDYRMNTDLSDTDFLNKYVFSETEELVPETLSTGIIPLDIILGGGVSDGDIVTLYSAEGVGKTTICLQTVKKLIDIHGKRVLYVDIESGIRNQVESFNLMPYIQAGTFRFVDKFKMIGEVEKLFNSIVDSEELPFDVIVVDSITNLLDDSMFERSILDPMMAGQAKAVTFLLQKFRVRFKERGIITFLINQERANLEAVNKYSPKTKSAGCKALKYIPDVIIRLKKGEAIKHKKATPNGIEEVEVGRYLTASADKNRKGNPAIPIEFPLKYGNGVSNILFLVKMLKDKGYVRQAGAYFKTDMLPNPDGGEWSLMGVKGLTQFVDTHFEEINQVLLNDNAYCLIKDIDGEGDDEPF